MARYSKSASGIACISVIVNLLRLLGRRSKSLPGPWAGVSLLRIMYAWPKPGYHMLSVERVRSLKEGKISAREVVRVGFEP